MATINIHWNIPKLQCINSVPCSERLFCVHFPWWSEIIFSWLPCLILYWLFQEKIDADHCDGLVLCYFMMINPFTPKSAMFKTEKKKNVEFQFASVKNKQYHMNVLLNGFHLNGHILGFHPQTQKVQPHLLAQGFNSGSERVKLCFYIVQTCNTL